VSISPSITVTYTGSLNTWTTTWVK
jgi:hypothetical protein